MNEFKLKAQVARGQKAKSILNDALVKEALEDIRKTIYKKIEISAPKEKDQREFCYQLLRAAEMFEGMFTRHIQTGIAAEEKLNPLKKAIKRVQEIGYR